MKKLLGLFLVFFVGLNGWGQLSISSLPANYSNNFNNYNPSAVGNVPSTINSSGVSSAGISNATTGWTTSSASYNGRGIGTGNTGGFWGFGSGAEFSLGALPSGSTTPTYTLSFTNNSGSTISSLTLAWNYEQWRYGGSNASGWDCTGTGQLASNSTLNSKDFSGIAGSAGTTNGLTTGVSSFNLTGLSITNGQSFGITWVATNLTGSDNGVAIDDFSISVTPTITGAATTSPFTTTQGTPSTAQTFAVSGANLTADVIATAPNGFEVSLDGSNYGTTAIFNQTSGSASGTLSIRIAASATAGNYDSQNIVLSSTGATNVSISTPASGNTVSSPLPVELVSFSANCADNNTVSVNWTTASEHNSDYYTIKKSRDGIAWNTLNTIPAAGNSTQLIHYSVADASDISGTVYYRLTQVDVDGATKMYDVVSTNCSSEKELALIAYPNPSNGQFTVKIENALGGKYALAITDMQGKAIEEQSLDLETGTTVVKLNPANILPGVYLLQFMQDGKPIQQQKLIIE
jgi:hypothetical protein